MTGPPGCLTVIYGPKTGDGVLRGPLQRARRSRGLTRAAVGLAAWRRSTPLVKARTLQAGRETLLRAARLCGMQLNRGSVLTVRGGRGLGDMALHDLQKNAGLRT